MKNNSSIAIAIVHGMGIHNESEEPNIQDQEKGLNKIERKKPQGVFNTIINGVRVKMKTSKENLEASLLKSARVNIEKMIEEIQTEYKKKGGIRTLVFKPIYWGEELQQQKEHLWETINQNDLNEDLIRKLMIYYLGDVIAYQPLEREGCFYQKIKAKVMEGLRSLATQAGPDAPLCVIAHSLGTIIASDYFVNLQHNLSKVPAPNSLEAGKTLQWFYTLGSPIAMYSLRYQKLLDPKGGIEQISFGIPVKVSMWKNFYDKNDLLAYPLAHLNVLYEACGVQDISVEASNLLTKWNTVSHTQYWSNKKIIDTIVRDIIQSGI